MKSKSFILHGDKHQEFIKVVASKFGVYSESELLLIATLIHYDMFTPFNLDKHTRQKLSSHCALNESTTATCLSRLVKAGVLGKQGGQRGKNYYFNIAFRSLDKVDCIVFKFK